MISSCIFRPYIMRISYLFIYSYYCLILFYYILPKSNNFSDHPSYFCFSCIRIFQISVNTRVSSCYKIFSAWLINSCYVNLFIILHVKIKQTAVICIFSSSELGVKCRQRIFRFGRRKLRTP